MATGPIFPLEGKRIWVAGHRGMVGAAIARRLAAEGCTVLTVERRALDLRRQAETEAWMGDMRPDAIFLAAATVGGILANSTLPAEFLYDNLMIGANVVSAAHRLGTPKLLLLGSSCVYPRAAPQPIAEDRLLTGPLEPTNEAYAVAKIAGIKLVQAYRRQYGCDFIAAMPTNLYGPGDNFDLMSGHVLPALLRKTHEAKQRGDGEMIVWGTGTPLREFLHVDDCADALVFLMRRYSGDAPVNIGSGTDIAIRDLAALVAAIVGYEGRIVQDTAKPDGMARKLLDSGRIRALGWSPRIDLRDGIAETYRWFVAHAAAA